MDNIATFLINLDRDHARLSTSKALLTQAGFSFERVSAIEGRHADKSPARHAKRHTGRTLTDGEIGCFLSHRLAAEKFLATDKLLGLVLEDDVSPGTQASKILQSFSLDWSWLPDWDVANLARPAKHRFTEIRENWSGPTPVFKAHYMPVTTTAILWNRKGAQSFLHSTETFVYPVDVFIQRWISQTDRGLAFLEPPFGCRDDESTIGGSRSAGYGVFSKAKRHHWRRILTTHLAARRHKRKQDS